MNHHIGNYIAQKRIGTDTAEAGRAIEYFISGGFQMGKRDGFAGYQPSCATCPYPEYNRRYHGGL